MQNAEERTGIGATQPLSQCVSAVRTRRCPVGPHRLVLGTDGSMLGDQLVTVEEIGIHAVEAAMLAPICRAAIGPATGRLGLAQLGRQVVAASLLLFPLLAHCRRARLPVITGLIPGVIELPVHVGALEVLVLFGSINGPLAVTVAEAGIRAAVQQQRHHRRIQSGPRRQVQRCLADLLPRIDLGPSVQ